MASLRSAIIVVLIALSLLGRFNVNTAKGPSTLYLTVFSLIGFLSAQTVPNRFTLGVT